ncbi:Gfo/Idh/MocA family protein [Spelaeicoccus albus]|uniref:Putative dehydrogenase n=1 Tax=Spelaeicoccus albus TaxID=1280376 RepID=A0A7Z0D4T2_9MICO|nr:Gfo/Idh/MocA family oxidoreductase [Spelaeicoccus albus]NYI68880.1 putative dehydrogenase [Spelaeicoccus albus]
MDLNIGIIGFGMRAGLWKHVHRPGAGSQVTMVCDVSERGRADAATNLPGAVVTAELDDVLTAGLDAVLVLTPDDQHAPVVMATLDAGIPTFCEKPLATTVEDCDALLERAYKTGTKLYVGHNMRHMPVVVQMRKLIDAGAIGEVKAVWCRHFVGTGGDFYFKDWHADRKHSTGLLLQKGAHDIDVIHLLAGGYTDRVSAMGALSVYGDITDRRDHSDERMWDWYSADNWPPTEQKGLNPVVDVEDVSMVNMTLDNGVMASYEQCHFTPDYWRNYTVIGTAGRLENFGDGPGDEIRVWNRRHDGVAKPDAVEEIQDAEGGHGGADPRLIAEFLDFVRTGTKTTTSPLAARNSVAVGCLATESIRGDGSAMQIPRLDDDLVAYFEAGQ